MVNVTLQQIATQLHLSPSTVSRALRDHPDIAPDTKARVKKIADELGFQPSILAKSLVQKRTRMIGALVPEINSGFFSQVIRGVNKTAREMGYKVLLMVSDENDKIEREILKFFAALSVDGILLSVTLSTHKPDLFERLHKRQIPIVFYDRALPGLNISTVTTADRTGARNLTTLLKENGYQRIAFMGPTERPLAALNRYFGYRDVFNQNEELLSKEWIIPCQMSEESAYCVMKQMISSGKLPDAMFCVNDVVALGAYRALAEANMNVPDDIALAGYGNMMETRLSMVSLTTVDRSPVMVGERAVSLLIDHIENPDKSAQTISIEPSIISRQSTQKQQQPQVESKSTTQLIS